MCMMGGSDIVMGGVAGALVEAAREATRAVMAAWVAAAERAVTVAVEKGRRLEEAVKEAARNLTTILRQVETGVVEQASAAVEELRNTLRPPILRLQATLAALSFTDDKSLAALVSRVMRSVRAGLGRYQGWKGYALSQILTNVEQEVIGSGWSGVWWVGDHLLHHLQSITQIDIIRPHRTAFRITVGRPDRVAADVAAVARGLWEVEGDRLLARLRKDLDSHWARLRYLLTSRLQGIVGIQGEAVVLGWERAITWDGRTVTPLLTDSCHHLLVLLTRAPSPTAVTLHLQDLSATPPRRVLTVFSGRHVISLDSRLKMTLNEQHVRRSILVSDGVILKMDLHRASIECQEGLTVECQLDPPLCRIKVDGAHFAATAGLLGVFDFDNSTDFMTSGWEMPSTDEHRMEEDWAQTWRVSADEQCSPRLPDPRIPSPLAHTCTHLFYDQDSPFSECYRSVPPSPYLENCRAGWECEAQDAYLHSCRHHYLHLTPRLACNTCRKGEGITEEEDSENEEGSEYIEGEVLDEEEGEGEEEEVEGLAREVVVVTDYECWNDPQELITALAGDKKKNERVVVRYIGFGSPSEGPFLDASETVVDSGTTPVEALLNAALLDFTPAALKSIVLFDCNHPRCTVSSRAPETLQLREQLLRLGVQLHVVTQSPLTLLHRHALGRKAAKQLIGIDGHTGYLLSHARKSKVKGRKSIRPHVTTPVGNTCTELAIQAESLYIRPLNTVKPVRSCSSLGSETCEASIMARSSSISEAAGCFAQALHRLTLQTQTLTLRTPPIEQ